MTSSTNSAADIVRRTLLKIDGATLLDVVDSLDLRASGKISAVIGVPLRNLQQRRDPESFVVSAPLAAQRALLEIIALGPLERVVDALGEHADNPSFEQLTSAVDQLLAEDVSIDEMVAVLGFAISEDFSAAVHCRRLLEERPEFELPALPDIAVAATTLLTPKPVDPEVKEQRRARREMERQRKKGPTPSRPARPAKVKAKEKPITRGETAVASVSGSIESSDRRRINFTPVESELFDQTHPLVGSVVILNVQFDAVDPQIPEVKSKERPVLIVGVAEEGLLVRALYSNPSPTRSTFQPWRRLGLDHVSYVDDARIALDVPDLQALTRMGQLTVQEWNALI